MNTIEDGVYQFKTDPEIPSSARDSSKSFISHHYVNKITIIFVLISILLFTITNIIFYFHFNEVKIKMGEDATIYYSDDIISSTDNEKDLEFVYINDIHLDPLYVASSSTSSFCRKFDERFVKNPYYFGQYKCDLPFSTLHSMLRFINTKIYPKNPSPNTQRRSHPNFVLLGGDTVAHFLPLSMEQSHKFVSEVVKNITISFNQKNSDVPILFVLGNNEYIPNYGSVNFSFDKKNFDSLYKRIIGPYVIKDRDYIESGYENYNPKDIKQAEHDQYVKEQKKTFKRGGYYYYDIPEAKLRILVMNTITYSHWRNIEAHNNKNISSYDKDIDIQDQYDFLSREEIDFLKEITKNSKLNKVSRQIFSSDDEDNLNDDYYINPNDPYGQFEWVLDASRDAEENYNYTVGIALHMPPGSFFTDGNYSRINQGWKTSFIKRFDEVIAKANIEFIISAHSHFDLFLPVNGINSISGQYSIGAPALSPNHWNNPGFRIFKLSHEGKLLDYEQYYADISSNPRPKFKGNTNNKSQGLKWKLDYSFKDAYASMTSENEEELTRNDDDDFDDISDFDQYNLASDVDDQIVVDSEKNPHFDFKAQEKGHKEYTGINKNTITQLIKWALSTTKGRWTLKERLMAHGEENGAFYKCLYSCTTIKQIYDCLGPLAPKVVPEQ